MLKRIPAFAASVLLAGNLSLLPSLASAEQVQAISMGEAFATTCFQCHGPEGQHTGGTIPPLAGYPRDLMLQQLKDFKSGKRPSTIMDRHVKGYSDAELEAIADYLATLKP
ncbi:c-type cytochrome [Thiomicrorhabdus xiamenensis]|uniref:C-type cytochrome n=1 Tax=Thiomicrorhabdus xiamenensis TaxID=2739063 RepID=A0A7D4TEC7_9GAMM|nr:c-type cytochrome [Thiomicrorhabdus xiamenensis]QKI89327.1 c-type cytochrome [Thiomicrorhabdus xiamenensis]